MGDLILICINSIGASVVEVEFCILIVIIINRYRLHISSSCLFYWVPTLEVHMYLSWYYSWTWCRCPNSNYYVFISIDNSRLVVSWQGFIIRKISSYSGILFCTCPLLGLRIFLGRSSRKSSEDGSCGPLGYKFDLVEF